MDLHVPHSVLGVQNILRDIKISGGRQRNSNTTLGTGRKIPMMAHFIYSSSSSTLRAPVPNPSKPELPTHHPPLGTIQPGDCSWSSLLQSPSIQNLPPAIPTPPELGPGGHTFPCLQNQGFSFESTRISSQGGAAIPGENPNPWTQGGKKEKGI